MAADLLFVAGPAANANLVFGADASAGTGPAVSSPDLVFSRIAAPSTDLLFGDTAGIGPAPGAEIDGLLQLPGLRTLRSLRYGVRLSASIALPTPGVSGRLLYLNNVARPTVAVVNDAAQVAQVLQTSLTQPQQHALPVATSASLFFEDASSVRSGQQMRFTESIRVALRATGRFTEANQTRQGLRGRMQDGDPGRRTSLYAKFQEASRTANWSARARFQDGYRDRFSWTRGRAQVAVCSGSSTSASGGYAAPHVLRWVGRYQEAWRAHPGMYVRPVDPGTPHPYWGTALLFACPPLVYPHLVFGPLQCQPPTFDAPLAILPARFYMTAHIIFAQRLPDLAEVPIFDASVSADSGSFCWTLQASGPSSLFEQLAPVGGLPVQLRLTLDGMPWVFAVDSLRRNNSFGKSGVSITGRSVTALIGAPYLRAVGRDNVTEDRLAQQLATAALDGTGVGLDWGLTDWLVPAGAWSHQGAPLDALQAIAQAAGGYLQSHRSAPTLLTRHPYANRAGDFGGAPWAWTTGPADVELAPDAIITQGTDRRDGADINGIYVSGTTHGVLALVKRTGTAADKLAAMVTDPLITHVDAARQRGLATLGTAGPQYNISLDLPVLTGVGQPGVLDVGQLVQVNTSAPWRGRVRSVNVSAKRPSLRQTITLERHL